MDEIDFFRGRRVFCNGNSRSRSLFSMPISDVDIEAVRLFLALGYVPGEKTLFKDIKCLQLGKPSDIWGEKFESVKNAQSPTYLKRILLESIEKDLDLSKEQVVPLSGGMDSRIVLGLLLEFVDARKIQTYTFGVRGSYDYEIPGKIAKSLGTKHVNFSSVDSHYSVEGLIRAAIASDGNTEVFYPLVLNRVSDYYGEKAIFWSGFAGDLVGGGFEYGNSKKPFIQNYEYEARGIHYYSKAAGLNKFMTIAGNGEKFGEGVAAAEAVFWENHVERYTAHHIFRNDMTIMAPLVSYPFLRLFLELDPDLRKGKKFFNKIFSSAFPSLFDFPTKSYGYRYSSKFYLQPWHLTSFYMKAFLWRLLPSHVHHPNSSYIDMQHAINHRSDVAECVNVLIDDLSKRDVVDSSRAMLLLKAHRKGTGNYTKDIINLASLEVILKAAKI